MNIGESGLHLIKSFEGLRLVAYRAVPTEKYLTIGYGHYGSDVKHGEVITEAKAKDLLKGDLQKFVGGVSSLVRTQLNQNQFDALVSFAYNCGLGNLKSSTLLDYVNAREFAKAANEFGKWIHAGGKVLQGLVRRRAAEAKLFATPVAKPKPQPKKEEKQMPKDKYFSDMGGHWTEKAVDFWAERDILNGTPDGTFEPERALKRGELAVVLKSLYDKGYIVKVGE